MAWLGEHDAFVDLAFDTLEQTFWALKALIYQSSAEEHNILPGDITEDMLESFIGSVTCKYGQALYLRTRREATSLGETVLVFDIADYYLPNDTQNMLINNLHLGAALAGTFSTPSHNITKNNTEPDSTLVLQRGPGFATVATSIEQAVYRAGYTTWNAEVLATGVDVQNAVGKDPSNLEYLTAREAIDCVPMDDPGLLKVWPLWVQQTMVDPLYKSDLMQRPLIVAFENDANKLLYNFSIGCECERRMN